jgi:uncharacterized SAM-binding protein YcdF (DUF218 family)
VYETASILFSTVMDPAKVLLAVLIVGAALLWTQWVRAGHLLVMFVTLTFLGIATMPIGTWLIAPLEDRFPSPAQLPERVNGIVVLGGATSLTTSASRNQPSLNANAERLTVFVTLARRFPAARLIYTGGFRSFDKPILTEATVATALMADLGVDISRLTVDNSSQNTMDNAARAFSLATPSADEVWLLITSARHMPRAVGVFRGVGWHDIVPYPVDYLTSRNASAAIGFNLRAGLNQLRAALHEWIGLIVYRVIGASAAIFPKP